MTEVHHGLRAAFNAAPTVVTAKRGGAAEASFHRSLAEKAVRHAASAQWRSTLAPADLACLLSVIEVQVLPRLLRDYRPADGLSIERLLS